MTDHDWRHPRDTTSSLVMAPTGLLRGAAAEVALGTGRARPLAGGPLAFSAVTVWWRDPAGALADGWRQAAAPLDTLTVWARARGEGWDARVVETLERLSAPRPPFAGLSLDRPRVMGILNCTPDSFSDGGDHDTTETAVAAGLAMMAAGADILDVGGESTRPGSEPVSVAEEMRRVLPVVRALADRGARVSIDSRRAAVMEAALAHGASILNDVTALTGDSDALAVAARHRVPVILMHIQGEPRTMQADPRYDRAVADVTAWLGARVAACRAAGLAPEHLCVDPGIGFGKTVDHNRDLLGHIGALHGLGCAVLLGASRKSFIAHLAGADLPPKARLAGSLAAALGAVDQGVQILRVHDVAETVQALRVATATATAPGA
ncbi:dihydropteroate synthase [Roseospira visakhapatnamensis]|uniref:dihydropteroate synthase n=1 Tax=Roseospira visakhapatnamensis TaxID=390880 RepID=A0A7W6WB91_9PROT|nr:dihydropteroate synthase [Roseospira visakhapatnamensis]MBB4267287.1 dihydropteroate synthase [Roseospira visakhapatnamensis]